MNFVLVESAWNYWNLRPNMLVCVCLTSKDALNTEVKDGEPSREFQEDLHTQFLYEGEKN